MTVNGVVIPASWLDANRTDVLKAIEEGVRQAVAERICDHTNPFLWAIEDGVKAAAADHDWGDALAKPIWQPQSP